VPGALSPNADLSPGPILEAVEDYRGTIIDTHARRTVGPADFAKARKNLIRQLKLQGLTPGDRVLVAISNGPMFVATLTAILACDASPLLVHNRTPPSELARYAGGFCVRFYAGEPNADSDITSVVSRVRRIDFSGLSTLVWGQFDLSDGVSHGPELRGVPLHPTSGSTGLPKIGLRPGFAAMEEARHYAETMSIDHRDCIMGFPPMSHAYGYGVCVMLPLLTGASIVTWRQFSAKQLSLALREQKITVLPAVPATVDILMLGPHEHYQKLRWLLAAGSILTGRAATQFRSTTGVTVCPLYGTTETGGISVATAADGHDFDGRVGPPMDGVEVDVWPGENASDPHEGIGRLFVRSSSMMTGYLDDQGNVTTPFEDGWFETGDLARIADDDTIQLRGRSSEVINVSGLKVVPCEVEQAIMRLQGVREVKVYAGENGTGTQSVKAAVAAESFVTVEALDRHCEAHLVYYKRPGRQSFFLIDALPRSAAGKIINAELP